MWAVMLGPDNRPVPEGKWEEYRERGDIFVWDVYCKKNEYPYGPYYTILLKRSGRRDVEVGRVIYHSGIGGGWNAFGAHGFQSVQGFKTRRHAIQYMLIARGLQRQR